MPLPSPKLHVKLAPPVLVLVKSVGEPRHTALTANPAVGLVPIDITVSKVSTQEPPIIDLTITEYLPAQVAVTDWVLIAPEIHGPLHLYEAAQQER